MYPNSNKKSTEIIHKNGSKTILAVKQIQLHIFAAIYYIGDQIEIILSIQPLRIKSISLVTRHSMWENSEMMAIVICQMIL